MFQQVPMMRARGYVAFSLTLSPLGSRGWLTCKQGKDTKEPRNCRKSQQFDPRRDALSEQLTAGEIDLKRPSALAF